jgi:hypothetical protein
MIQEIMSVRTEVDTDKEQEVEETEVERPRR